jgi:hypothetical protein
MATPNSNFLYISSFQTKDKLQVFINPLNNVLLQANMYNITFSCFANEQQENNIW